MAFDYTDTYRSQLLEEYKTPESFIQNFSLSHKIMSDLVTLATSKGIEYNSASYDFCKKDIEARLKAYIGRGIHDNEAFYPILLLTDKTFLKALRELEQ